MKALIDQNTPDQLMRPINRPSMAASKLGGKERGVLLWVLFTSTVVAENCVEK
jgi:hypothetical protein